MPKQKNNDICFWIITVPLQILNVWINVCLVHTCSWNNFHSILNSLQSLSQCRKLATRLDRTSIASNTTDFPATFKVDLPLTVHLINYYIFMPICLVFKRVHSDSETPFYSIIEKWDHISYFNQNPNEKSFLFSMLKM